MFLVVQFGDFKCSSSSESQVSLLKRRNFFTSVLFGLTMVVVVKKIGWWKQRDHLRSQRCQWQSIFVSGGFYHHHHHHYRHHRDHHERIEFWCRPNPRWMCLWTLETAPESRSGVERTQDTSGCTNIKRLASIGSLFQVGTLAILIFISISDISTSL